MVISIDKARYVGEYKIKFSFSDGVERLIDFSVFFPAGSSVTRPCV